MRQTSGSLGKLAKPKLTAEESIGISDFVKMLPTLVSLETDLVVKKEIEDLLVSYLVW
jgi:hypothetical protein